MIAAWLLLGLALALAYIGVGRWLRDAWVWWGGGLAVAAAVYVGFALASGSLGHVAIELVGALGFGAAASLGVRRRDLVVLAWAWALHPAWDLGVHLVGGLPAPAWYVWTCLSFDLAVAAALALGGVRRRALRPSTPDV